MRTLNTNLSYNKITMELSYVVMQASWRSAYDVRVSSTTSNTQLTYYGSIINDSGENWVDVCIVV